MCIVKNGNITPSIYKINSLVDKQIHSFLTDDTFHKKYAAISINTIEN